MPPNVAADIQSRLSSVRTVEQFRANFTPEELRNLSADLACALTAKSRAILDGIGNRAHRHAQRERFLVLMRGLAGQIAIPCPLEELEGKLEEKSAELGRQATVADLGPAKLAYPSKAKFRQEVSRLLGKEEAGGLVCLPVRTIIRWERELEREGDTEYDPRIFKTQGEQLLEKNPARLVQNALVLADLVELADSAGK
jgi:hypothetical protein